MEPPPSSLTIAPFEAPDAEAVAAIFVHYVEETVVSFETQPRSAARWRDIARSIAAAGWPFLVGSADGGVVGFAYVAPWRTKPAYRHTVESTVYLAPGWTGRGHGRSLLEATLAAAAANGARQVIAVIADSGDPSSRRLHERLGFDTVGVLREVGFKHGRWVDVTLMQLSITPARAVEARAVEARADEVSTTSNIGHKHR